MPPATQPAFPKYFRESLKLRKIDVYRDAISPVLLAAEKERDKQKAYRLKREWLKSPKAKFLESNRENLK